MNSNQEKTIPRLVPGFRDLFGDTVTDRADMIRIIQGVYEKYGFTPLETPAVEYVDVLGKFLPEASLPDAGIFSFRGDGGQWEALRYDLTAPLSRVVAMYNELPLPYRRYQIGPVWRVEKPGPGRYREFYQFDIDTVGSGDMAADTEVCLVLADAFEALGFNRGDYILKVNNRKILNAVLDRLETMNPDAVIAKQLERWINSRKDIPYFAQLAQSFDPADPSLRAIYKLDVLRCIDKFDRLGERGVVQLLGNGRKDESGDFTPGAYLEDNQIGLLIDYMRVPSRNRKETLATLENLIGAEAQGVKELRQIDRLLEAVGVLEERVIFDTTMVRGLSYYTGPVFEGELLREIEDETGKIVKFGSVAGGGRYDDLVMRFTGTQIPATGASIGVDRLLTAYRLYCVSSKQKTRIPPVLITRIDPNYSAEYQQMVQELRQTGIAAELYLAAGGMRQQIKYADKKGLAIAVIAGSDEFAKNEVTVKDLWLGKKLAETIKDRNEWRDQPAQVRIPRDQMIGTIRSIMARYATL